MRKLFVTFFAATSLASSGCHGRVSAFFYRITHCNDCCPSYGGGVGYAGPVYGGAPAAPCCSTPAPAYGGMPVSYSQPPMATPIFNGSPMPIQGPSVYPTPPAPMPEKK